MQDESQRLIELIPIAIQLAMGNNRSQIYVGMVCPLLLLFWVVNVCCTVFVMDEAKDIVSEFLATKPMFWAEVVSLLTVYLSVWVR